MPQYENWTFQGWFTGQDCAGTKYYNADGSAAIDTYENVGPLTLYAGWKVVNPLAVDLTVNGDGFELGVPKTGAGWSYDGKHAVALSSFDTFVISGSATNIFISIQKICNVTLSNLTLVVSMGGASYNRLSPVSIDFEPEEGSFGDSVRISLEGENVLVGGGDGAAIGMATNVFLDIRGPGSLAVSATGRMSSAIGGTAARPSCGSITVYGATLTVKSEGVGIGAADSGTFKTISIHNSTVSVESGGVGIGGGDNSTGGHISISNSTVDVTSDMAGIGLGWYGHDLQIDIDGGTVSSWGYGGAAIGAGQCATNVAVRISGGEVHAVNDWAGAAIGGGYGSGAVSVEISGGVVTAVGNSTAAAIGCGAEGTVDSITISGGTVYPSVDGLRTGDYTNTCAIGNGLHGILAHPVVISGGAIYTTADEARPDPQNAHGAPVFPLSLPIGLSSSPVRAIAGYFMPYGIKDMFTNPDGDLEIWVPAGQSVIVVTMDDGNHYFHIRVGPDGENSELDFLLVNGEIVAPGIVTNGTGWACNGTDVALTGTALVEGIATNGTMRLVVPSGGSSDVTISNLTMMSSAQWWSPVVVSNSAVVLTVQGTNTLEAAGTYSAGILVCSNATLTLRGEGALFASGGSSAAGIGSAGGFVKPGAIRIQSGTVYAFGGENAAGIGGGVSSNLREGNIAIEGGFVTAQGGKNAAGIGSGYVGKVSMNKTLPKDAVVISGGTVLSARGEGNVSDLISSGNTLAMSGVDDSLVITGGSVHGANLEVKPTPWDGNGTKLYYVLFTGLTSGKRPEIASEDIPATYGWTDVVADETGAICLWLPQTNLVRNICVDGLYFAAGGTSNNVFAAAAGNPQPPPSRPFGNNQTAWRVELLDLNGGTTVMLSGLSPYATKAFVDSSGDAYVYLPDGDYAFTVDGQPWEASVSGEPAIAYRVTGVSVNGVDAGRLHGDGARWLYEPQTCDLKLIEAGPYVLSGTNTRNAVRCRVSTDAHVTLSNLCIRADDGSNTPFAVGSGVTAHVWFTGTNELVAGDLHAAIEVPKDAKLVIDGDGWLQARGGTSPLGHSDYPAIGPSEGMDSGNFQNIFVNGGNYVLLSGVLKSVGVVEPVIAGGNVFMGVDSSGHTINMGAKTPGGGWASCLIVPDLEPGAPVTLTGLPDYYNTTGICANTEGKIYLYLPVSGAGEEMRFNANGSSYAAVIKDTDAAVLAEKVAEQQSLRIESVTVGDARVSFVVSGKPTGWLAVNFSSLRVCMAAELPMSASDDVPSENVEIVPNADGTVTVTLPRSAAERMFYKVRVP